MNTLRYKNRAAILSFVVFCLTSVLILPIYHFSTEIEHIQLELYKNSSHQQICFIERFVSQLTGGYIDKDCEDSHEEEEAQTNKTQYLIKQGEDFKKASLLHQIYTLNSIPAIPKPTHYFLQIDFILSDYNFSPFCNNFSNRSPPQILI